MPEDIAGRLYPFRSARRRWRAAGKWLSGFIKQGVCQVLEWVPWRVRCAYPPYKGDMVKSGGFAPAKKNAPTGRFSAGSRDCKGGGGVPPLHVRVRGALI